MATQISNPLVINLTPLNSGVVAAARTYTATRQLRLYDLKVQISVDPGLGTYTCTVSNGATTCLSLRTATNPDEGDIFRLGQNAADTCDDAQMVVAAGGTCVFAYTDNDNVQATLYAFPL
jgi:hypothetical protein